MAVYKQYQWEHLQALVWEIESDLEENQWIDLLSEADQGRFKHFKNPSKKLEFLNTRAALHHLTDGNIDLSYSERGAPQLNNYRGVSISHNKKYAAVVVSKEHMVGIDLEAFRPQMLKLTKRFLSQQEINSLSSSNEEIFSLAYWSAKETLIKIEDDPGLDLRKEIRISPFAYRATGMSKGIIRKNGNLKTYPLFFKFEKDFCLCFSYQA